MTLLLRDASTKSGWAFSADRLRRKRGVSLLPALKCESCFLLRLCLQAARRCYSGNMQTWMVDAASRRRTLPVDAVATLLHAADDRAPAARLLEFLNQVVAVDFLSLVSHVSPLADPAPRLVEGHSQAAGGRNVTAECFAIYRQRYWQNDRATEIADHLRGERLAGRFTFLYKPQPGQAYSINLCRRGPRHRTFQGRHPAPTRLRQACRRRHRRRPLAPDAAGTVRVCVADCRQAPDRSRYA